MTTKNYLVTLNNGSTVQIEGVARVEKDGSGLRFYDEENGSVGGFADGTFSTYYPASSTVTEPPAPVEPSETENPTNE